MNHINETSVKKVILDFLQKNGVIQDELISILTDDHDLLSSGIISSVGYIELISELENQFSVNFDFENTNPDQFSSIKGIVEYLTKGTTNESV